jgi:hypothetical protein
VVLGLTIAFSPPHLGLLFWLMLSPHGLMRASLLVASWLAISALTIGLVTMVVRGSLGQLWILPAASTGVMTTLIDSLAAVALVTVAGWSLVSSRGNPSQHEGGFQRLLRLPLPVLLALSCGWQLLSPEDGLIYAKALNQLRQGGLEGTERFAAVALLWLVSSSLMVLPLVLLVAMGPIQVGRLIEPLRRGLDNHGKTIVAILSLSLASYLGWQGWIGWQAIG